MGTIAFYIIGIITTGFGLLMTIPGFVDVYYGNISIALNTFAGALISIIVGVLFSFTFHNNFKKIQKGEIFLITCLIWVVISAFSALPFYFNVSEFNYTTSYFESISALTTTGITAVSSVNVLSEGLLLWRSLLQWIGGIGIVVMAIAVLPVLRVGGMQLFYTESSENMDKTSPSMATIMYRICFVYFLFSAIFVLLLWLVEMSLFDAINFSFAAISTGGGNITHDSAAGFFTNPLTFLLLSLEMLIGAVPSIFLFYLLFNCRNKTVKNSQVFYYLKYILILWSFLTCFLWITGDNSLFSVMVNMFFYVSSFASTTGLMKDDFLVLGSFVVSILLIITLIGGCTGSTAGGIKIFRFQVMLIMLKKTMINMLNPHQVVLAKYNDKKIENDVISGVFVYLFVFIATTAVLTILMIITGVNPMTSFTSVISCIVNNGFGFGDIIGPYGSFINFPDTSKLVLAAAMLLGRLEFLTALILFLPSTWKKN